ncbi:hypothetical protein [Sinorhizobium sp. BJ1]|uniref:hypothetical protein n=1 Tax=Sinorhizobium sp. BJ1 TaxID=2035455 RepID=UPI0011862B39|nr:hypothetical protein [Sinorhizobium sp. BJ1]
MKRSGADSVGNWPEIQLIGDPGLPFLRCLKGLYVYTREGNPEVPAARLTGDFGKSDFFDGNAHYLVWLELAVSWYCVLIEPPRIFVNSREYVTVVGVHGVLWFGSMVFQFGVVFAFSHCTDPTHARSRT